MFWKKIARHFKHTISNKRGAWVYAASAVISIGSTVYSSHQAQKGIKNAKGILGGLQIPEFEEDPDYRKTQDAMTKFGMDLLKGDVPDYYKSIGETGGPEFEQMLSLQNRDIGQYMTDAAAATGRRGGGVQQMVGQAVGENTAKNRWADYARSLVGKENLMNTGVGVTERARGAGQAQQAQVNAFALDKYENEEEMANALIDLEFAKRADKADSGSKYANAVGGLLNAYLGGGTDKPTSTLNSDSINVDEMFADLRQGKKTPGVTRRTTDSSFGSIDSLFAKYKGGGR